MLVQASSMDKPTIRTIACLGILILGAQFSGSDRPAAAQPAPSARTEQRAVSSWVRDGSTYFVEASKAADPQGRSTGVLGQIGCTTPTLCTGSLVMRVLGNEAFTFDPAMGSASLEMRWSEATHVVEWSGEGAPTAGPGDVGEPALTATREADASGSFLFQDFQPEDDPEDASLTEEGGTSDDAPLPEYPFALKTAATLSNDDDCITFKNTENEFARLINKERSKKGKGKLKLDAELGKAARKHTTEMIEKDLLHHTSSTDLVTRIIGWTVLGENVGVGGTVGSLHDAFMASPPHKKNILYSSYRHVGVGVAKGGGRMWVTVIFQAKENPGTTLNCVG